MRLFNALRDEYQTYNSHNRPILKWSGVVGAVAFPLFYALQLVRVTHEYDNVWLRAIATLMCLALAMRDQWPQPLRKYYLAWSYATFVFCMPFFFIFMSLKNGGGSVAVANTFMAVFFLILLTDWRNTIVILLLGMGLAVATYILTTASPAMPQDYVGRWPPFVLVVIGGSILKFSQRQIQAERLDALTALAGSIAHEMRHPLGQVQQSLRAIGDLLPVPVSRAPSHTVAATALEGLYRQLALGEQAVSRGLQVVSMTLDEVNSRPLDTSSFSLISAAQATERAVREYGYERESLRDRVRLDVVEDFTFRGDETSYFFVLFNLLKNALYYVPTHPDMVVTITVRRDKVTVRDSGPGIPPEILAQLFQPFVTGGKTGGTGLGLAYCRKVMESFGGAITCDSVRGQFTQFDLAFPPLDPAQARAHEDLLLQRARAALSGRSVLVVDDDAAQRLTTNYKLQATGARIEQASDGERALEALARGEYALVLLDLNMPVMDGYEFAHRVRRGEVPGNRHVPVVAYTSDPPHVALVKTRKAGMNAFIGKPASRSQLLEGVLRGLENAKSAHHPAMLAGRRIVLADDSSHNRKAVAAYLRHAGATVVECEHGQAVVDELREHEADAVLLDISMPGMDGFETARAIRALAAPAARVPIVALTAHSDAATVRSAQSAGMNSFIVKPVESSVLYDTLAQLVAGDTRAEPLEPTVSPLVGGSADALLNTGRLESYVRIGMLGELLDDYLPEIAGLVGKLQRHAAQQDLAGCMDAMHSLLGMSGEAGAQALYQLVRRIYVPMAEAKVWPQEDGWVQRIASLAAETERALKAYAISASIPHKQ